MKALFHLNKYFLRYRWHLLLGILFVVIQNIFNVYAVEIIHDAVEDIKKAVAEGRAADVILWVGFIAAMVYLLIYLIKGVFLFMTRMTIIVMSRHIEYDLKNEVYEHYQKLDVAFYKRNKTGDLMNRISEDVSKVRMYLGPAVMYTLNLLTLIVVVLVAMLRKDVELTILALMPLPFMSLSIYYVSSIMNRRSEAAQAQQSRLSSIAQETFSGIRVLKAFNREKYATDNFLAQAKLYKTKVLAQVKVDAFFMPIILMLVGLSTAITIYIGGTKYIATHGAFDEADIISFVFYINMLTWPFAAVGWVTSLTQQASASQKRINEFLGTKPQVVNHNEASDKIEGGIEFKNVSFTYPDSGITALKNVSFKVAKGQTIAVIGSTGSGKSTLTALVNRLYDTTEGEVLIDGRPVASVNLNSLHRSIGYVPQEVFLFSDSIANNISFGEAVDNNDRSAIEQAAKDAVIYDNIQGFKEGF